MYQDGLDGQFLLFSISSGSIKIIVPCLGLNLKIHCVFCSRNVRSLCATCATKVRQLDHANLLIILFLYKNITWFDIIVYKSVEM